MRHSYNITKIISTRNFTQASNKILFTEWPQILFLMIKLNVKNIFINISKNHSLIGNIFMIMLSLKQKSPVKRGSLRFVTIENQNVNNELTLILSATLR